MKKLSLVKELMPDIAKIVSSLAEELPNMSPQEQRKALVTIRRLKNTQSTTGKTKKIPTTDDELWERIRDEVGDEIPRVAVCDDHDAPFDFVADYYFERKRAILVMANREGGKCITGDSLIYDPITGLRTSIDEVIDNPYIKNITSMNKNGDVVICDISSKWDMGEKECLKIKLSSGRDIIVTPEHPFMIQDGWYKADEIEIGDAVATPSFLPFHLNTKEIPKSHLILISGLLAEGSINEADVNEKRGASFSSNDDYFIELMTDSAEDIGCEVSYASCYDYNIVKEKNSGKYNKIRNFLKNYEISCKLAKNKIIPDIIYEINEKQLCEFLSIFWMCDGYVTEKEAGICLASKQMVYDIQHLLLKLGIQSRIRYKISKYDGKEFDSWALSVYGNHIEYFYEKMDLWDYKKDRLEDLVNKNRCPSAGRPPLTDMMIEELRKKCPRRNSWDFSYKTRNTEAYNQLGWKVEKGFGVSALNRGKVKNLQARRLRALCHARDLNEKEFSVLLNEDLWWDFVVNIEKVGMKKVYDLTINDTHTFVANDIIVHNTKSVNIANYLNCEDKPGCEVCVFADIEAQSNKSYNYVKSFIYTKNKDGKKIPKSTIDGDPLRKETRWKSGSKLEVIIASKSGVNSPHPHKVHADEIDLMDREIWDESRSMASTGRGSDGKTINLRI